MRAIGSGLIHHFEYFKCISDERTRVGSASVGSNCVGSNFVGSNCVEMPATVETSATVETPAIVETPATVETPAKMETPATGEGKRPPAGKLERGAKGRHCDRRLAHTYHPRGYAGAALPRRRRAPALMEVDGASVAGYNGRGSLCLTLGQSRESPRLQRHCDARGGGRGDGRGGRLQLQRGDT